MSGNSEQELVGVAHATDRIEGEMIQGLLEGAGIPSVLKHVGLDGPQLGFGLLNPGGGSRQVMVRADQIEEARAVLTETLVEGEEGDWTEVDDDALAEEAPSGREPRNYNLIGAYTRIWVTSIGVMALAFAVFMLLRQV